MMYYRDVGKGKPVVLIHGFLENSKMWDDFSKELSQNYRLIIPDLLGHGKTASIADKHTMEMQAKAIIDLLKELKIDNATFIGHSMGGYTALSLARDYPEMVGKLCLFFSNSLEDSLEKKQVRLRATKTVNQDKNSFTRLSVKKLFNQNNLDNLRHEIECARELAQEMPENGITAALLGMREREDTTQVLQNADYPIQIILGEYDDAIDLKEFQKVIPQKQNIQTNVLPIGHMGHLEAPTETLKIIQNFLNK